MKYFFLVLLLVFSSNAFAKLLQVPEDCVSLKTVPCLIQIQGESSAHLKMGLVHIRASSGAILKWLSYKNEFSLQLITGQVAVRNESTPRIPVVINSLPMTMNDGLVQRQNETLEILDLNSFFLSTFSLRESGEGGDLKVSRFLDKSELVQFVSKFYRTKSALVSFLQTIQASWKEQFDIQANSQTNVLARSIASIENEKNKRTQADMANKAKLKKVREEFFYRTFYR